MQFGNCLEIVRVVYNTRVDPVAEKFLDLLSHVCGGLAAPYDKDPFKLREVEGERVHLKMVLACDSESSS